MRVRALLSHYFQPDLSAEEEELAMTSWIKQLSQLPQAAIEQACDEWEGDQEKRPTPAAIRKRALARIQKPEPTPEPPSLLTREDQEAEAERRRALCAKLAPEFPEFFEPDGTPRAPQIKRMPISEGDL